MNRGAILLLGLALGFGAFLLATIYLIQHNLLRTLSVGGDSVRPNLVLIDIQPDQLPDLIVPFKRKVYQDVVRAARGGYSAKLRQPANSPPARDTASKNRSMRRRLRSPRSRS